MCVPLLSASSVLPERPLTGATELCDEALCYLSLSLHAHHNRGMRVDIGIKGGSETHSNVGRSHRTEV